MHGIKINERDLFAKVLELNPDLFAKSEAVSNADRQMMAMTGQYLRRAKLVAESGDSQALSELTRRKKLTERAYQMLKPKLSKTARNMWENSRQAYWKNKILLDLEPAIASISNDLENETGKKMSKETQLKIKLVQKKFSTSDLKKAGLNPKLLSRLSLLSISNQQLIPVRHETLDKVGYINSEGKLLLPFKYRYGRNFSDGVARVKNSRRGKWIFIDKEGRQAVPGEYDEASSYSNGVASVGLSYGDALIYIDKQGRQVVPGEYDWAGSFHKGLATVSFPKSKKDRCYHRAVINKQGDKVLDLGEKCPFSGGGAGIILHKTYH